MQRLWKSTFSATSYSNFPPIFSISTTTTTQNINPTSKTITKPNHTLSFSNQISSTYETPPSFFSKPLKNSTFIYGEVDSLHAEAIKSGKVLYSDVSNYLLTLYVRRQSLDHGQKLFEEIPIRDVRSWTISMTGFARMGLPEMALNCFVEMQSEGVLPNHFTLSSALKCCAVVNDLEMGKKIHGWILRNGVGVDVALENSMVDLYVKCGVFDYARRVFELMAEKNSVSWNIMIGAYLQNGDIDTSLELFRRHPSKDIASWNTIIIGLMRNGCEKLALELLFDLCRNGVEFNDNTFSIALLLSASLSVLEIGRQVHGAVFRKGYYENMYTRNSLIDMYSKCGDMERASNIFSKGPQNYRKVGSLETNVSWSSMISGYVQNGKTEEAFELFHHMVREAVEVDPFTLTSIVAACADVGISVGGRQIHAYIEKIGYKLDEFLLSAIIDMYTKCGSLHDALSLFHQSNSKNIVLWTSMISGCALHGQGREAIWLFQRMLGKGIRPNEISFIGVLSGCSHAGLVEEGQFYFRSMVEDFRIVPKVEHFTCMVDLLGRAGRLSDAKDFIYRNNISHLSSVWKALLSACQIHKNIELATFVTKQLHRIEPSNVESYVLLSNIYTTTQRWKEAAETRSSMHKSGFKKHPGQSWIRLKNQVHTFVAGDRSHPQASDIYSFLEGLISRLKEIGYSTDTNLVTHDVEDEQREVLLGFHSEKLAIAYGIMSTPNCSPILVMKNLRVCVDCHNAIKYISLVTNREITVRDARRFHHFYGGHCSCGDYW